MMPAVALAQPGPSQLFIHVPNSSTSYSAANITQGVQDIINVVENDWTSQHGPASPNICVVGYAGSWQPGSPAVSNNAGVAANALGGFALAISYCDANDVLTELKTNGNANGPCDIIIGLGEGGDNFRLELHGSTDDAYPDCEGQLPPGRSCTCDGPSDGCEGSGWNDPPQGNYCIPTLADLVGCELGGEAGGIPVETSCNAGRFLCGYFTCHDVDDPDRNR